MDSNEQVRIRDIILFGLSVFTSVSVITLVIIQYLLWKGEEGRAFENLRKLSSQIEKSFSNELGEGFARLDQLDKIRLSQKKIFSGDGKDTINYKDSIIKQLRQNDTISSYYPFDRVSWVDPDGKQILKAEIFGQPVFTNVKDRKYFKAFKDSSFLTLRLDSVVNIGWEPIYSWTNADFNISISKKTVESGHLAVLATKMYSAVDVLMPVGYGFCIIDNVGEVQLHSDVSRNLSENFFEKVQPSSNIRGMIAARQEGYANEVALYGKSQMVAVRPLKNLPYSIVTFYDKGFIVPVNMRILIFAILFSILSGLINVIFLLLISRIAFKHILVYSPMDFLSWLPPRRIQGKFYSLAFLALLIIIAVLILLTSLFNSYGTSNYTILAIGFMTPINVVCGLYLLKSTFGVKEIHTNAHSQENSPKKWFVIRTAYLVFMADVLISLLVVFFSVAFDYRIHRLFFIFQILFVILSILVICFPNLKRYLRNRKSDSPFFKWIKEQYDSFAAHSYKNYNVWYNLMATALVICLSVMPTGLYVWYAQNQEIIQGVKKHQLHFANGISERTIHMRNQTATLDSVLLSPAYLEQLIYQKGIYTIHDDIVARAWDTTSKPKDSPDNRRPHKIDFEKFYFDVADRVSNSYYDPQLFPSLRDIASDERWYWEVTASEIKLWYQSPNRVMDALQITSTMPERYRFIGIDRWPSYLILVIICLLLRALYLWLQSTTKSVFLRKYVTGTFGDNITHLRGILVRETLPTDCIVETPNRYSVSSSEAELNAYEKELLQQVRTCIHVYDKIWKKCTEKEKYLLFDFAHDGLINYKNTPDIYSLFSKGIFKVQNERIKLFHPAFRTYIITQISQEEVKRLQKEFQENSTWQTFREPLLLTMILIVVASIIFFTRAEIFQQILAFGTGLTALIALIPKIFGTERQNPKQEKKE
ncbi:MAG: cache domain-containing protein [Flavitalea sp.]